MSRVDRYNYLAPNIIAMPDIPPSLGTMKVPKVFGGSGSGGDGMDIGIKDYTDARIGEANARTDAKFAELLGEVRVIGASVNALSTGIADVRSDLVALKADVVALKADVRSVETKTAGVKWNIVSLGVIIAGLIIGLAAFGGQMFSTALSLVQAGAASR